MNLKEEYAAASAKPAEQVGKIIISNDAYAVCDFIERLMNKIARFQI